MRVLLLGPYPPPHGGIQTHLVALRRFLRKLGIPCAVINITRFRRPNADQVYYPKNALQLALLLLRIRYDIIHLHLGGDLTWRLIGLCLVCSLLPWAKVVFTFHSGGYPVSPAGRKPRPATLRGIAFRRLDCLIAVNPEIATMFREFGVPEERLRLIRPYAISSPAPETTFPGEIADFFRSHRRPLLLTVGLLEPEYDLRLQIEVLGLVRERHPNAGLVIIGDGSCKAQLRACIQAQPYARDILLCGDLSHSITLRAIAECDVFLRTTLYDGDSIAVREALHAGVPVIATDNGMRPEGTVLIPACNAVALRNAIEENLDRPKQPMTDSGEQNLEAVVKLYQELG